MTEFEIMEKNTKALQRTNWRIIFTAGMGFFTDAYDLFIIGVVTAILSPVWHLSIKQLALLNGASLAAAALGAIFFGTLSDFFGRKKMYGVEILILFFGAIISALAPNFTWLLCARIIVGFGIGGDYPSSAVVASEYAETEKRGYTVLLVFAMQALGLTVGPLLASLLIASSIPNEIAWRILLGLGAVPAALVFYLRRKLHETPAFLLHKAQHVSRVIQTIGGIPEKIQDLPATPKNLFSPKWLTYLFATAGAWFLLDIVFYGNGISSLLILDSIDKHGGLLSHTLLSALIFLVFAVPGYFLAATYVDRIGRKNLQILGFVMITLCYASIAIFTNITAILPLFLIIFGVSFFFVNFGPNTTTFLIPAEVFPTRMRAKAHGISAAIGKLGAFIGAFYLPLVLKSHGLHFTLGILAILSIIGAAITFLLPEMKKRCLSETENS